VHFEGLCEFIDRVWLVSDGAEKISIFNGLSHSINNYAQNFNRVLLQGRSVDGLTKNQLLEAISKQATRTISKLNKFKTPPVLKKTQKLQKTVLETATHNWIKANIHLRRPIQFLQQVSHCIDDGTISFLMNYDLGENKTKSIEATPPAFPDLITINPPHSASSSATAIISMTEPPPLIFYDKQATIVSQSEPPPLIPITRNLSSS
jgi:hypothetical protein